MLESTLFQNWDLLVLGIVIIVTAVLGFIVYFENPKSPTRKSFLGFTLATSVWGIFNYLSYHIQPPLLAFYFLKLTIFAVTWMTFFFLEFSLVFPREEIISRSRFRWILLSIVFLIAVLTLTPFVFESIESVSLTGTIARIVNGPALPLFGMMSVGFTIVGLIFLLRKTLRTKDRTRKSYHGISVGVLIMFALIITSNFIFPVFFDNARYIQFGALFVFPFIALTSYAILKNRVFNVKVISAELFITILLVLSLLQLIQSQALSEILLRSGIFLSFLGIGILLIKSVLREVEQREQLQILTQELEEFVGFAAHQVKGPMNNMKGFAQLIEEGSYGEVSAEVKATAAKIRNNADQTIELVNNLLNVRKIESGEFLKDFNFETIDLAAFLRTIVDEYKISAGTKHLALSFTSSLYNFPVRIDRQKIHEVIKNLIENSIKYTDTRSTGSTLRLGSEQASSPQASSGQAGFIKVGLEDMGDKVLIVIVDSGRGMSKELQTKLFQRFVRDEQTKKEIQGTGLGLFIAKQIVEAHKGEIWAESDGEGKGSRFYVRLKKL